MKEKLSSPKPNVPKVLLSEKKEAKKKKVMSNPWDEGHWANRK